MINRKWCNVQKILESQEMLPKGNKFNTEKTLSDWYRESEASDTFWVERKLKHEGYLRLRYILQTILSLLK